MTRILRITLPATLTRRHQAFGLFLGGLWQALPKSTLRRLAGLQEHVALEIHADQQRLLFRFWTPTPAVAQVLLRQARAHFPEIAMEICSDTPWQSESLATAELTLGLNRERPLRTLKESDADPMAGLLASLSGLRGNEWGLLQILVRPALAPEMETQAFDCLIRVATSGDNPRWVRNRLGGLIAAFGQFAESNALRPTRVRLNARGDLETLQTRRWPALGIYHSILTRDELATIYHFPSPGEIRNLHLETTASKRLPLLISPPVRGVRLGTAISGSNPLIARVEHKDLLHHLLMVGATGTGKSTLLCNMALDLVDLGMGVTVMDPHGSLVSAIAEQIPQRSMKDTILIRFADVDYPIGLNFLTARPGFEFLTVDELIEICQRIYTGSYWGPILDMMLRHTAYAALETGGTLIEMARLLDDDIYRQSIVRRVRNPETRRFLIRLSELREGRREQRVASTLHRLQRFLGTPFIRNIVGQRDSSLDIRQIMDSRQILLIDLSGIGVDNAKFLGSLLTLLFRQAALSRENIPESQRAPHYLIMDECSWFISRSVGEMADQARKFKLGLILAAQRLSQLKTQGTLEAILAEASSLICFRMGAVQEARHLAQHLNTADLAAEDIRSLGQYEVYAQILQRGAKSPAFWAETLPPAQVQPGQSKRHSILVSRSRQTYTQPREKVEREMATRERSQHDVEPEKKFL